MKKYKLPNNNSGFKELHIDDNGDLWLFDRVDAIQIKNSTIFLDTRQITNIRQEQNINSMPWDLQPNQYQYVLKSPTENRSVLIEYFFNSMEEMGQIFRTLNQWLGK